MGFLFLLRNPYRRAYIQKAEFPGVQTFSLIFFILAKCQAVNEENINQIFTISQKSETLKVVEQRRAVHLGKGLDLTKRNNGERKKTKYF